ncbi:MAG: inositol monophosphatase [Candidatus Aenigmarchaeota archaeon]|nr:inositol monophosphatase [Candidatus Aenigmarchaeota archaeon]
MVYEKELKTAVAAARAAGKIIRIGFGKKHAIEMKEKKEIATEVDKKSEIVIKKLLSKFDYSFLGEETGLQDKKTELEWIVDPLDGTTNFSICNPFFNVSIGLVKGGKPVMGVVYNPIIDELFTAVKGKGAFLNGKRIFATKKEDFGMAILGFCTKIYNPEAAKLHTVFMDIKDLRKMGSAALELCYVAAGRLDGFVSFYAKPWDIAAGILIAEEAGTKITDFKGKSIDVNTKTLVAAPQQMHRKILERVSNIEGTK